MAALFQAFRDEIKSIEHRYKDLLERAAETDAEEEILEALQKLVDANNEFE